MEIRRVWRTNFCQEISAFNTALDQYKVIAFDTEFPGFLRNTPRYAPSYVRYDDLKYNVDNTKMIQLGISLSDHEGNFGGTWEFNFSEFDMEKDNYMEESIRLLQKHGLDFDRMKHDGIPMRLFVPSFSKILSKHAYHLTWITFQGLYDLAYLLKLFINDHLPSTENAFADRAAGYFSRVVDIKVVAEHCNGLLGCEMGLSKLAKILKIDRTGESHNAGSDSLLTAAVYARMKKWYELEAGDFEGVLYGMAARIRRRVTNIIAPRVCQPLIMRPTFVRYSPVRFYAPVNFMPCTM